ncbi:MAG TPA: PEP-CTERM sorting domain-containing protein [Myxococcota bacterium]|nr:PEP-CTERM sorting domain-containing protein [Myxococcota bacterium]
MVLPVPRSLAVPAAALLFFLAPNLAWSTLIGQTVGVSLTDGSTLSHTQNVVVSTGAEINPGDGSPIGGVLLPTESVDIAAQSITLSLEEGAPGGATGYPSGTHFTFSNLVFSDEPTEIVGIHVMTTNLTNLTGVTFTGDSVTVPVDAVKIGDIPGIDVGSLTVALEVMAVPEPSTGALVIAGLVALGCARRGRRVRAP